MDIKHATSTPAASDNTIYLKDYQVPDYLIDQVELEFQLDERETRVTSRLSLRRNPQSTKPATALRLDGNHLQLVSIELDGRQLSTTEYESDAESLTLHQVPEQFLLVIQTRINPKANTALEGLYYSSGLLCTQCEAEGFRRITYFLDRPDVMARYRVTLRGDKQKYPVLLCNGNLVAQGEDNDGQHWACWEDPSLKPCYLFALVAGQLVYKQDEFVTLSERTVTLRVYVEPENSHKCEHALLSLKQAMRWDEETYGREYDLDIYMIVAVNDFNMGAMENKGLNIFNASCVLASPATATDADYYNIQSIIAHEYFHNWSGNRVTCRDWFQLSLKEGFTVFRDQEFSADLNSRAVKRIDDVNVLRIHQFAQDAGPMAHPVRPDHYMEISNFYTVTVYNKGAEVVRMIRNLVGGEGFRRGTDLYFTRYDGQAVTTEDFVKAIEDANQIDLTQFKRWYDQAGTPLLKVQTAYDTAHHTYRLTIQQTCAATPGQPDKQPFHIPLEVALLNAQGQEIPLQLANESVAGSSSRVLEIRQASNEFNFINVPGKPVISLNRGFTAPVNVDIERDIAELAFLFAHDSDEFNRWDAGQALASKVLLGYVADIQQQKPLTLNTVVVDAFKNTLTNPDLDKALIAQALTLPSESYLALQCQVIDVDAIHTAREFMCKQLAQALQTEFLACYQACQSDTDYVFTAEEMARRDLKNVCLGYLMTSQSEQAINLCLQQYQQANNMSDALAALSNLSHYDIPQREEALSDFYNKWQHDAQVVEKWFALQASADLPDALQRVIALQQHEAFSMTNPNKVRALIGRFCMANLVHFHQASGAGYAFLADKVLQLDDINPQIAARMAQFMSRWRLYEPQRQALMQAQLQRIQGKPGLSKDVYEIVSRSLQG